MLLIFLPLLKLLNYDTLFLFLDSAERIRTYMINPLKHFLNWVDNQVVGYLWEKVSSDWEDETDGDGLEETKDSG